MGVGWGWEGSRKCFNKAGAAIFCPFVTMPFNPFHSTPFHFIPLHFNPSTRRHDDLGFQVQTQTPGLAAQRGWVSGPSSSVALGCDGPKFEKRAAAHLLKRLEHLVQLVEGDAAARVLHGRRRVGRQGHTVAHGMHQHTCRGRPCIGGRARWRLGEKRKGDKIGWRDGWQGWRDGWQRTQGCVPHGYGPTCAARCTLAHLVELRCLYIPKRCWIRALGPGLKNCAPALYQVRTHARTHHNAGDQRSKPTKSGLKSL